MRTLRFAVGAALFLAFASFSSAIVTVNRVFVSARSGNDANSCNSILTPCQTFAGAVAQVSPGGEVIVLDSGGYGPVTIAKSLTIEAPPGVLAFVHPPSGDAITINAGGTDVVVLRGLTLNGGSANGIVYNTGGVLHVENCIVNGFGTAIEFQAAGHLYVKDTILRENSGVALDVRAPSGLAAASVERSRIEGNNLGLWVSNGGKASVRDTVASGNSNTGFLVSVGAGSPGELNIEGCLIANNGNGIRSSGAVGTVRVSTSIITDNTAGLVQDGSGTLLSRVNNTLEGNGLDTSGTIGTYTAK